MFSWLLNLKVRFKLTFSYALLIFFLLIIGLLSLNEMSKISSNTVSIGEVDLPGIDLLLQVDRDMNQAVLAQRTLMFTDLADPKFEEYVKENENNIKQAVERWDKYKAIEGIKIDPTMIKTYEEKRTQWIQISNQIVNLRRLDTLEDKLRANELSLGEGNTVFTDAREYLDQLTEISENNANQNLEDSKASYSASIKLLSFGMLIIILISVFAGNRISKLITSPLAQAEEMMDDLKKGHIKARIDYKSGDELGNLAESMNSFANTLEGFTSTMYSVSNGDLSSEARLLDTDDELSPALNKIVYTLRDLQNETNLLIKNSVEGNLNFRGNLNKFEGAYKEIIAGVNNTLDAVILPIQEGSKVLEIMAKGDFTKRVSGDYKGDHQIIKNSINTVAESLNSALLQVSESVQATASAASQISSSTEEMAAGSQELSSQTSEVATAVEEMTSTILQTTKNANTAAENSRNASQQTKVGVIQIKEAKKGMDNIIASTQATGQIINSLANKTDQIGEIAQVIDDIADQTNLLALNAAIEAARAGEQGRGFAVVADEVRKLAERTTKATKEIAETIKAIQREAKEADSSMEAAGRVVTSGIEMNNKVEAALINIDESVQKVAFEIDQVAAASEQQSTTSEEISKNIESISSVTNETTTGIHQIARAAEDLNRLTVTLQDLVSRFKIDGHESSLTYNRRKQLS
ncbi:MAG: methyl-accepting chemotaxis protein [Ignavibacteriaceae bacterium]|nr:methyl-accepting chemotaxis protein [Ignavibacteriaceae bacterium]